MAEKKFFVDINLQGSALTNAKIGTNSGIGSTEGAFGYDSSAHRLQYFDGTATKEVANLSDIAAVTGGLIFQGGYDPTTNTPDIADGSALKGFFWAATAAGTFLGESVQVGDSIVAKVDNAGATIADWLILQGNIVIATDSVDGISRLATQTEANDGTEGGAVVITPATLQGKIDAQITPEINSKVSKSGDTMSGDLNMGGNSINGVNNLQVTSISSESGNVSLGDNNLTSVNNIEASQVKTYDLTSLDDSNISVNNNLNFGNSSLPINLPAPTNGGDATNKTYVDDNTNNKLPLAGGTMSGDINLGGNYIQNATGVTAEFVAIDVIYANNNNNIQLGTGVTFDTNGNAITNVMDPTNDGDAANKLYVDNASNDKLPLAGGTMSGAIDMGNQSIYNANRIDANQIGSPNNTDIISNNSLDLDGNSVKNLAAPTNGGDATNKTYVDGVGATAESNANAYTDTAISAQSFTQVIATSAWTLSGSHYESYFVHNLGSDSLSVTTKYDGRVADFAVEYGPTDATIISNFIPDASVQVSLIKAGGNL